MAAGERPVPASRPSPPPTPTARADWALVATLAVVGVVVYLLRDALLPFVFAAAVAFVFDPVVGWLMRRARAPRWAAAGVVFVALLGVGGGAGCWAVRLAAPDVERVVADAPGIARRTAAEVVGRDGVRAFGRTWTPRELSDAAGHAVEHLVESGRALELAATGAAAVFGVILTIVLTLYFLIGGPRLLHGAIWAVPPERRASVEAAVARIAPVLWRYLVGVAVVVLVTAGVGWVGFGPVFHIPHAGLLAVLVGGLETIPVVGPITSAAIVCVIALQRGGPWAAVSLAAFAIALRFVIDNVVGPLVLGTAGRIHPVVVIFSFLCGATLFGVLGLLLAVPTAASVRALLAARYDDPP
jgi:predicted PurR-regulated permease PerM